MLGLPNTDAVLVAQGVHHRYGDTVALNGVDLVVGAGECVTLLGPNGAGKTTLVGLTIGLLAGQGGRVRVAGGDPRRAATRRNLGVVQQASGLPSTLKAGELVAGAAVRAGAPRSAAGPVLDELGLDELAGRRAARLSGGQRQRVALAMALVADPALLVLDEPTVGLDAAARAQFWEILARRRERGTAVLLTTHVVEETRRVADRVVVLHGGRVLADERPDALAARIADRTVTARTTLDAPRLEGLPGAVAVRVGAGRAHITTRTPEALLRVLLAQDPHLSELTVEGAGLEEAAASLTAAAVAA